MKLPRRILIFVLFFTTPDLRSLPFDKVVTYVLTGYVAMTSILHKYNATLTNTTTQNGNSDDVKKQQVHKQEEDTASQQQEKKKGKSPLTQTDTTQDAPAAIDDLTEADEFFDCDTGTTQGAAAASGSSQESENLTYICDNLSSYPSKKIQSLTQLGLAICKKGNNMLEHRNNPESNDPNMPSNP